MLKLIGKHKKEYGLGIMGAVVSAVLYIFLRYVIAPIIKLIWVGKIEGIENIPARGPVIIASNHGSYLDFICFWAIAPRSVQYLAAEVFYKSKFWRPIMIATGQIKVERDNQDKTKVLEQAHYILRNEGMLGIFPEGTRTRTGELGKAYTGVVKFALKAKAPIVPVGMIGAYRAWPPHKKLPRLRKVHIKIDKPIYHHDHYDKEHTEDILRWLTDDLMAVIAGLIGQEYKHHNKYLADSKEQKEKIIEGRIIKKKHEDQKISKN
ncbi:hypothetical protein COX22_03510 [Candidatus Falkowbacteria bacterium CG23_combo_of_CG06-09_8_20_14_all_49_15]|uniref:Phospholipid/glycerol acyltransferase domain-containing protein n=1 Tax=Candidatus Falkowbacteria bacterium CG23_combo_of_CG06-09_8_20_14_all_49_15 TaxID=1974572 RepID=A0A2G9ZK98_9BACT|nr:MAG: hypothetical protein COX22_03510 [Candidatus Falkowbacteria bacterium CG23_combo_of_CG06-09_8_20_14_all_49_15]